METVQFINVVILIIFIITGYYFLSPSFSFKVNKPYKWENDLKNGLISKNVKKLEQSYPDKIRFYNFWLQIERLKSELVPGAFAELGVYKGETANLIYEMDNSRPLHLFDTFEGFHKKDLATEANPEKKFNTRNFSDTSVEAVRKYINGNDNIKIHPGFFPQTAVSIAGERFALVHLDADLYQPTKEGLNFFYPRLNPGGVIIVHDYNHTWPGVKKAVDEFVANIPETIIEIPDSCGSVMVVKGK